MPVDNENMDGTEALCRALYGRDGTLKEILGGSNAKMLYDAVIHIEALTKLSEELERQRKHARERLDEADVPLEIHIEGGMAFSSIGARCEWLAERFAERGQRIRDLERDLAQANGTIDATGLILRRVEAESLEGRAEDVMTEREHGSDQIELMDHERAQTIVALGSLGTLPSEIPKAVESLRTRLKAARDAIEPVLDELRTNHENFDEPDWNPEYELEVSISIAEIRALQAAFKET